MRAFESDLRSGAQCVKMICSEPSTNTPGSQRRIDDFIQPLLEASGIQIDESRKGRPRWLKDRLQLPCIIRRYVIDYRDCWRNKVVHDSLDLLFPAHQLELAILIEHTNCAERNDDFRKAHGRSMTKEEEGRMIFDDLTSAEKLLTDWHAHQCTNGGTRLIVVKAVGIVSDSNLACERRLEQILPLEAFYRDDADETPPARHGTNTRTAAVPTSY